MGLIGRAGQVAAALLFGCLGSAAGAQETTVDLELLLAIDTSSSISTEEYGLQVQGLAEAFRDPAVAAAIRAAGDFGIAVAVMQWAESKDQVMVLPWTPVRDGAEANAFAAQLEAAPRRIAGGATAIGSAIEIATEELARNGYAGLRKVIDISGDGRANHGRLPTESRDAAVALGITINGLAILNELPLLDRYFREQIVGGSGAFVLAADDWTDFAVAILAKLVREISGAPLAVAPPLGEAQLARRP